MRPAQLVQLVQLVQRTRQQRKGERSEERPRARSDQGLLPERERERQRKRETGRLRFQAASSSCAFLCALLRRRPRFVSPLLFLRSGTQRRRHRPAQQPGKETNPRGREKEGERERAEGGRRAQAHAPKRNTRRRQAVEDQLARDTSSAIFATTCPRECATPFGKCSHVPTRTCAHAHVPPTGVDGSATHRCRWSIDVAFQRDRTAHERAGFTRMRARVNEPRCQTRVHGGFRHGLFSKTNLRNKNRETHRSTLLFLERY